MKTFIFSTIIFIILLSLVCINSIYIHNTCNTLISKASSISSSNLEDAEELCKIWQRHQLLFSISIHDSHIERVTELTENIKSAVTDGDDAEFQKNIALLYELLDELKKNEEISFQGII